MKAFALTGLVLMAVALAPSHASAYPPGDLEYSVIHFEVPTTDVIPGIAAIRASCDVNASGESLILLSNASTRSTLAASAGPCTIVLVLFGADIALPVFDTTPLGRSSFYVPGISTISLGIVDVSVDLETGLNSTSRIADGIVTTVPSEVAWRTWGAQRILVHAMDGVGSRAESQFNTTFTYTMSVALTVYAISVKLFHANLTTLGSFRGSPSLVTHLAVDLRPHAQTLAAPETVGPDRASFSWSGTVDSDLERLDVWLTDGTENVTYRLPPTATHAEVLLRPVTHYEARVVSVDGGGQQALSNVVAFDSPAAPTQPAAGPIEAQGNPVVTWTLVTLAILSGFVGFMWGSLRRRKDE